MNKSKILTKGEALIYRRKLIHALIPLVFLSGCATDDPKNYQPSSSSSDTGRVCLYRTELRHTPGFWQDWFLDGRWYGQIRPDRYYCMNIHLGRHIVRVGVGNNTVEFTLDKDQQVFVRFDVDVALFGKGIYPVLVDPQTARKELKGKGYDIDGTTTAN